MTACKHSLTTSWAMDLGFSNHFPSEGNQTSTNHLQPVGEW